MYSLLFYPPPPHFSLSFFFSVLFLFLPQKYFHPLKSQENASLIDSQTVDEIFLMVPDILHIHQQFLTELRRRLEIWGPQQRVGDAFVQVVKVYKTRTR